MLKTLSALLTTLPAPGGAESSTANESMAAKQRRLDRLRRAADHRLAQGRPRRALALYRRLLDEKPEDLQLLNRTGELLEKVRKTDQAVVLFARIARTYEATGFDRKAAAMYRKVLRLDPNHADGLGYLYGSLAPWPAEVSPPRGDSSEALATGHSSAPPVTCCR